MVGHPSIRLSDHDLRALRRTFRKHFLSNDELWVFGSRVDLARKGGDIDLYIETHASVDEAFQKRLRFMCDLDDAIGEQKIDPDNHAFMADSLNQIFELTPKLLEILDNIKKRAGRL